MLNPQKMTQPVHPFERAAFIAGALGCLVVTIVVWSAVSSWQPMWPLPAFYLIEIACAGVLAAAVFIFETALGLIVAWFVLGILVAFCALGALSVGVLYVPTAILFAAALISSHIRRGRSMAAYVGVAILGGVMQAGLMFAVVGWAGAGAAA
jgi:hypothetical protein